MILGTGEGGIARLKCTKGGLSVLLYQGNRTVIAQIAQLVPHFFKTETADKWAHGPTIVRFLSCFDLRDVLEMAHVRSFFLIPRSLLCAL